MICTTDTYRTDSYHTYIYYMYRLLNRARKRVCTHFVDAHRLWEQTYFSATGAQSTLGGPGGCEK